MRNNFEVKDYVTAEQIKSLFSRFSADKRKGKLKEPIEKESTGMMEDVDVEEVAADFTDIALTVMTDLTVEVDKWILVVYEGNMFPGIVKEIYDGGAVLVSCMEYDEEPNVNKFRWPKSDDIFTYNYGSIICMIEAPEIVGVSAKNKRKHVYAVTESDWLQGSDFINESD